MVEFYASLLLAALRQSTLLAFLAGLGGLAVAAAAYSGYAIEALGALVLLGVAGYLLDACGRRVLRNHPLGAVSLFEGAVVAPLALAMAGSGLLIIVGVTLDPPEGVLPEAKGLLAALAATISCLVTTSVVAGVADSDDGWLSGRIQSHFESMFKSVFAGGSNGEQAVFSDPYGPATGWGPDARRIRAKSVAEAVAAASRSNAAASPPPDEKG